MIPMRTRDPEELWGKRAHGCQLTLGQLPVASSRFCAAIYNNSAEWGFHQDPEPAGPPNSPWACACHWVPTRGAALSGSRLFSLSHCVQM